MSFHVGQKVVCVDPSTLSGGGLPFSPEEAPIKGQIYTVHRCFIDDDGDKVLHLVEIARDEVSREMWGPDAGYGAFRFRPLITRSTETGMAILRKVADDAAKRQNLIVNA